MFTIPWIDNGKSNWYYQQGAYMLKKQLIGERTLYKLYKHEVMIYNTFMQHEFLREVSVYIKHGYSDNLVTKK
jgi:hypothetical protein